MVAAWVGQGGVWKKTKKLWVRNGGAWKEAKKAWVGQGGVWKLFHQGSSNAVFQYLSAGGSDSNGSQYSFTLSNIGAAAADRLLVVQIFSRLSNQNGLTSAPFTPAGGAAIPMTLIQSAWSGETRVDVVQYKVPTATTGSLAVNFSGTKSECYIGFYRITGQQNDLPYWSTKAQGTIASAGYITVAPPEAFDDGVTLGFGGVSNAQAPMNWLAPLIENYDLGTEGTDDGQLSGASALGMTTAALGYRTAESGAHNLQLVAAHWR